MGFSTATTPKDGELAVYPEAADHLWHLYNLIKPSDEVSALTFRKHRRDANSSSSIRNKGSDTKVFRLRLSVIATKLEFDPDVAELRVSGPVTTDTHGVCPIGSFHTLRIIPNMKIVIKKEEWKTADYRNLRAMRGDSVTRATTGLLLIELGLANIFLVSEALTRHVQTIRFSFPRRISEAAGRWTGSREAFFIRVAEATMMFVDPEAEKPIENMACLIIGGPGFAKTDFVSWLNTEVPKRPNLSPLTPLLKKIVVVPSATVHRNSVDQVINEAKHSVQLKIQNVENEALSEFKRVLAMEEDFGCYGEAQVLAAGKLRAIKKLLITGLLLRTSNLQKRLIFDELVDQVQSEGGSVIVFSEFHPAGEQLQNLSGIAAILKYGLSEENLMNDEENN